MRAVLIITDNDMLGRALCECLSFAGLLAATASDGETGLQMILSGDYALVVMALPASGSQEGLSLLRRLRTRAGTPVILLLPRAEAVDRIVGPETGADDCLSEPFTPREVSARMHAILRRTPDREGDGRGKSLHPGSRLVRRAGEVIDLTAAEFSLLDVLLTIAGRIVRREDLATRVLGRVLSARDRSLDTHVSRLRRKLGPESSGAERIKTIRKVGYLYVISSSATPLQTRSCGLEAQ
jgi:two-component system response regulator CpxR